MLFNQSFSGFFLPKYYYDADLISNCNHWNIIICHWIFLVCLHHQLFFQLRSPTNLFLIFTYFLLFFNIFHQIHMFKLCVYFAGIQGNSYPALMFILSLYENESLKFARSWFSKLRMLFILNDISPTHSHTSLINCTANDI